jgi:hypothetical protein
LLKTLYIIVAIICAMLALSLFGYGIAHGFECFYLVFPLVLSIFALPLWLEKRIRAKSARLAALAYAVPLIALTGPIVFLFLFNPWYEERVATAVLNEIKVAVVDETPIKNRNGHLIGVKITYTFELPETVAYGGVAKKLLEHTGFPKLQLRSLKSPEDMVNLNTGFDIFYQNARQVPPIVGIKSGKYTVESWRVPSLVKMQTDGFCKSKPYAGLPESVKKVEERAFDFPRQPFALEMGIWVLKSYRMGGFAYDFRPAYTTKNEFDGLGLRKAVEELPPCDAATDKRYISPPKGVLDHLQDFVAP